MAQDETPQYDTMALLVLLERLRRMPQGRNKARVERRMRKHLGGR